MQRVKNTASRLVTGSSKYDYITSLLQQLHRFPVSYRVVFKILLLVYKARHGLCPGYVSELLQERKSSRALRSSSLGLLATPTLICHYYYYYYNYHYYYYCYYHYYFYYYYCHYHRYYYDHYYCYYGQWHYSYLAFHEVCGNFAIDSKFEVWQGSPKFNSF